MIHDVRKRRSEQPNVPEWIRTFSYPGWTNVFHGLPKEDHLYGTETLFGDWNGSILLLAKDWGPTSELERALRAQDPRPWRHAERGDPSGWRSNETLARLASIIPGGKLYGSATANMLYDDPRWSRALRGFESGPLNEFLQRVLSWVLDSMPRVKNVACLGNEAWSLTSSTIGNRSAMNAFADYRNSFQSVTGVVGKKKISAFALYHPAARVTNESKEKGWRMLATALKQSIPE
jgi:hypothetical protein